ncbi:murein biosynthesis integral membrane protein MurJ [Desulfurobacterium atlanticum]|uniref:Probable lipid II flippase MurJ n=1 Tax=Desulfurobacterium atlanticum TaxID=240169 RepID=A0A238Y4N6_9BACT|nr:murein biosynthesis integral membrane protein MurJ [Desulfurobacterium atlanticum]SNR66236.1 putative peptidoglycan lipid II flippase [Desulfurobacterium atlanticum]
MPENKSIGKSFIIVSLSIFSSRIFGLLRDVVIASTFGAGILTDIFFVAFRVPNMLRRIFAEGAFSSVFTPAFARKLKGSEEDARLFAGKFFSVLLVSLIITVLFGEIFAPLIIKIIAPGFKGDAKVLAVSLTREMFPYILLVSLVAFFGGILNGYEHFFAPAFSTVLFNISLIVCAVSLKSVISVHALALGVVLGGVLQLLLQVVFLKKVAFVPKPIFEIDDEVKKALRNIIPGLFGFGVRQLSMLADTVIASFLYAGAISYLYYANRFVQLPLGIFAIGISQVLLPRLAKNFDSEKGFKENLVMGLILCSMIIIPSMYGLIFFGKPLIDVVFHHGEFTWKDLNGTYYVLCGYGVGLLFYSFEKIVVNAFYSLDDYKYPVKVGAITLVFNVVANIIFCFVFGLGAAGLAFGTSLTSLLNVVFLVRELEKRVSFKSAWIKDTFRYFLLSVPVIPVAFLGSIAYFHVSMTVLKVAVIVLTVVFAALFYFATLYTAKDRILLKLIGRRV